MPTMSMGVLQPDSRYRTSPRNARDRLDVKVREREVCRVVGREDAVLNG